MSRQSANADSLSSRLLNLYDEFSEFSDNCAFFCDAIVCIAEQQEILDEDSACGLARFAEEVKLRARLLKDRFR